MAVRVRRLGDWVREVRDDHGRPVVGIDWFRLSHGDAVGVHRDHALHPGRDIGDVRRDCCA
jgi:hypothetical protein